MCGHQLQMTLIRVYGNAEYDIYYNEPGKDWTIS